MQKDLHIFRSIVRLISLESWIGLRRPLFGLIILIFATAVLNATIPLLFKALIDHFLVYPVAIPVLLIGAYIVAQFFVKVGVELRWGIYGRIEQKIQRRLTLKLFDHVHSLSLRFHLDGQIGALQQVVGNGLLGYCLVLQNILYIALPLVFEFFLIGSVIIALGKPAFLAILMITAVLYITVTIRGVARQRESQQAAVTAKIEAAAISTDSYINYETIKYFGAEGLVRERFNRTLEHVEKGWTRYYERRTMTGLSQALCLTFALTATLVLAVQDVYQGTMTVGGFVLVVTYLIQILHPLETLTFAYREIKTGINYVDNLLDLLDERAEVHDTPEAKPLPQGPGDLVFHRVCFAYDADRPILKEVSFQIPPNRVLAIVGPSGSGKSTILRLLFRLYDMTSGYIKIDGHNLNHVTLESLRQSIAIVPQDTILFNDTLAFNISIARPHCRREEIEEATRLAGIADFIASLPDKYETIVGERGLKLSGGERQRIAIARALLKQPRILVLDEATSMLDSKTECAVLKNIQQLSQVATTLLITHRLSAAVHADEILVLVEGRVVEYGKHNELLRAGGFYSEMWRRQKSEEDVLSS